MCIIHKFFFDISFTDNIVLSHICILDWSPYGDVNSAYIRCTDTSDLRHFGPETFWHYVFAAKVFHIFAHWTLLHQCRSVSDISAQKCMRQFWPRIKSCIEYHHCVKKCRPTLCLLLQWNGIAWKMIDKSCIWVNVSSHTLLATKVIGQELENATAVFYVSRD